MNVFTFSIQTNFPNQIVSLDRLTIEIQQSSITIALNGITTVGDVCQITFKTDLSSIEITTLGTIVASHSGSPIQTIVLGDATIINGYNSTSTTSRVTLLATQYTEQSINSARSFSSSSPLDASGSLGATSIRLTYFDQTLAGPFTEDIVLKGTTVVNTVSTTVCFVESIKVLSVGVDGNNVGTINMFALVSGSGGTIGSIAVNDNQTNWCHHYVAVGKTFFLTQILCGNQGASNGNLTVLVTQPTLSTAPDVVVIPQLRIPAGSTQSVDFTVPIKILGPARILLQIKQDASSMTNNWFGSFSYQEI